jgi:hypothetical protein
MSQRPELDRFLRTDPRDVGCAAAMDLLHVYAELVAAGGDAPGRYAGVAAHLRACGPCGQDYEGLLAAVSAIAGVPPGGAAAGRRRRIRVPGWAARIRRLAGLGGGQAGGGAAGRQRGR